MYRKSVRKNAVVLVAVFLLALVLVAGCSKSNNTSTTSSVKTVPVKIGTLPTEDSLPLWVAEDQGIFGDVGLKKVELVSFQSAQERDAALAAGAIDGFMGDIIAAANLEAGGTPVTISTLMLGADQSQGRFGIVAPKTWTGGVGGQGLADLAGNAVPVGTSSATIQEYVLDGLMRQAGVPQSDVKTEEVKKVPVRFELLMAGKLKAAALPEPFLSLAIKQGAKLIADDTDKAPAGFGTDNLSQTVLLFSDKFLKSEGGLETQQAMNLAWDHAATLINKDPNSYRSILVEKAGLPKDLESTYEVNTYPLSQLPSAEDVTAVTDWMKQRGYLKKDVTYSDLTVAPK